MLVQIVYSDRTLGCASLLLFAKNVSPNGHAACMRGALTVVEVGAA